MLWEAGADIALAKEPLKTALDAACAMGQVEAIRWLLDHDPRPVDQDSSALASQYNAVTRFLAERQQKEAVRCWRFFRTTYWRRIGDKQRQ